MSDPSRFPLVLQIGEFPRIAQRLIDDTFDLVSVDAIASDEQMRLRVGGIVTRSNYDVDAALIERLPALGIIATSGVGYDRIPVDFAQARGVTVTNTPELLNAAVAELTVGLLLALLRQLPRADAHVRSGVWSQRAFPLGSSLAGKRVGIIGVGRIGKDIVRRLLPFDVRIAYSGRSDQGLPWAWYRDPVALAEQSDVLIACCPGGADTRHLVNADVLAALGPAGVLVNVARGSVVDETALIEALASKTIAGAALDVFDEEPLRNSALCAFDNVVLSPHIGSATHETRLAMAQLTIDNLKSFFSTGKALTPVTG
jgi:lactate dehydrogenase-like 2-hydroxyacid dehydrogenase